MTALVKVGNRLVNPAQVASIYVKETFDSPDYWERTVHVELTSGSTVGEILPFDRQQTLGHIADLLQRLSFKNRFELADDMLTVSGLAGY